MNTPPKGLIPSPPPAYTEQERLLLAYIDQQAAEIEARLKDAVAREMEIDGLREDAHRYRWLRAQHWSNNRLAVVCNPKDAVKLGQKCPSLELLNETIDAAMRKP